MTERLIDLFVAFDEMGFSPTIPCENLEKAAIEWKEKVIKEIEAIEAKNDALRDRLENAVERLKTREQSVCFGTEWKAVVTDEDIDEVFGIAEARLAELKGETK